MKFNLLFLLLISTSFFSQTKLQTPFEKGNGNQTTTYQEMGKFYDDLAQNFKTITVESFGTDNNGEPIKVVIFNPSKNKEVPVILINN